MADLALGKTPFATSESHIRGGEIPFLVSGERNPGRGCFCEADLRSSPMAQRCDSSRFRDQGTPGLSRLSLEGRRETGLVDSLHFGYLEENVAKVMHG